MNGYICNSRENKIPRVLQGRLSRYSCNRIDEDGIRKQLPFIQKSVDVIVKQLQFHIVHISVDFTIEGSHSLKNIINFIRNR